MGGSRKRRTEVVEMPRLIFGVHQICHRCHGKGNDPWHPDRVCPICKGARVVEIPKKEEPHGQG